MKNKDLLLVKELIEATKEGMVRWESDVIKGIWAARCSDTLYILSSRIRYLTCVNGTGKRTRYVYKELTDQLVSAIESNISFSWNFDESKPLLLDDIVMSFDSISRKHPLIQGKLLLRLQKEAEKSGLSVHMFIRMSYPNTFLDKMPVQCRLRLIKLALCFDDRRPLIGISPTVGYIISSTANDDIKEISYREALGKNLSVEQVHELIDSIRERFNKTTSRVKSNTDNVKNARIRYLSNYIYDKVCKLEPAFSTDDLIKVFEGAMGKMNKLSEVA